MASGRKRKERRRARLGSGVTTPVVAEAKSEVMNPDPNSTGSGVSLSSPANSSPIGPSVEVIGGPDDHRLVKDLQLAEYAIRHEWPITAETRKKVISAAEKHIDSSEPRVSIAAQRVVISADSVNQRREANAMGKKGGVNVNVGVGINGSTGPVVFYLPKNGRED